ncbi:MAG: ISAs1 family transposase [Treponema sp.]
MLEIAPDTITDLELPDKKLTKDTVTDKAGIFSVQVLLQDGTTINTEIQNSWSAEFIPRTNQQSIHRDVKEFFEHPCDDAYCQCYHIQREEYSIEIGHGRIEKRTCYLCSNIDWLSEKDEWKNLNAVGMLVCERTVKKTGKKSVEQRYFLTSLKDVQKAAFAMRAHWGIENNLHWVLDAILDEDYCLVRKDNEAANLSVLRKIVLNMLKQVDFSDIVKAKKMFL